MALGRSGEAHASLEHALAAAEPDGLYGPFLGGGEDLPELLKSTCATAPPTPRP